MTQAIGYVRRSTDKQDLSLEQQRAKLEQFAAAKGWTLATIYSDDAISGSEMNRPGLAALVARAEQDKSIGAVLAWDRNRLARPKDPIDGLVLERKLLASGKRVCYVATGLEADRSFASGLMGYVEHFQNGDYLRKLSRDTIRGIVSRVEQGHWPGGPIPFGYDRLIVDQDGTPKRIICDLEDGSQAVLDPKTGQTLERVPTGRRYQKQDHEICTLIPSDPSRVRAVQKMFADFAAGKPTRQIREELNRAGFRTSRGRTFAIPTVTPILESPAYVGQCVYNRRTLSKWHRYSSGASVERLDEGVERRPQADWITVDNAWPALVERGTWDQVQARRKQSRQGHIHVSGRAIQAEYLLVGLMTCGVCGARMMGHGTVNRKGYRNRYYACSAHHAGHKDKCPRRYTVPADVVERHVLDLVQADLLRLRDDDQLHLYVAEELRRITNGQSDTREQLQRRLAGLDQQLARLREHVLAVNPDTAKALGLYEQADNLNTERQAIERDQQLAALAVPTLPDAAELRARASASFDQIEAVLAKGTLEEKRELISTYVQTIKADPDQQLVRISLFAALFSRKVAGGGFEPPTSGL